MQLNNMWINYFRFGSFVLSLLLFSGCERFTTTDRAVHGQWVYVNESTHTLEITGIWSNNYNDPINFLLRPGDSYMIKKTSDSLKECSADHVVSPFVSNSFGNDLKLRISVDNGVFVEIDPDTGIWDRENYRVEKLKRRTFRFSYAFTDDYLRTLFPDQPGQE